MFVEFLDTFATPHECYTQGTIHEFNDARATHLIRAGLAKRSTMPPLWIDQIYEKMSRGKGQPCIFTPFVGEFGHYVLTELRRRHWHQCDPETSVICCREGEQVLYPRFKRFHTEWFDPIPDVNRGGTITQRLNWSGITDVYPDHLPIEAGNLTPSQELHYIHPGERIPFAPKRRGLHADVCLGIRNRAFCPQKNYRHWQYIANALTANGYTFAVIGRHDGSQSLNGQTYHAGDYLDTDAAIELLQNCRLYIGSDTGCTHLAAEIGTTMVWFREVQSGQRNFAQIVAERNGAGRTHIIPDDADAWNRPEIVKDIALELLNKRACNLPPQDFYATV